MESYVVTTYENPRSRVKTSVYEIEQDSQLIDNMPPKRKRKGSKLKSKNRKSVQGDAIMCDLSEQDQSLFLAISFGKIHRIQSALEESNTINIRNHEMQTLLIYSTHTTNGPVCNHLVRALLASGSDVNAQDVYGRTALMYACADNTNDDVVRLLIRRPTCDPNLVDCEGNSALMFAVAADSVAAVEILLKHRKIRHKVNVNIVNCMGLTALDMAVALKEVECCKVIVNTSGQKITKIADEDGLSALIGVGGKAIAESSV